MKLLGRIKPPKTTGLLVLTTLIKSVTEDAAQAFERHRLNELKRQAEELSRGKSQQKEGKQEDCEPKEDDNQEGIRRPWPQDW